MRARTSVDQKPYNFMRVGKTKKSLSKARSTLKAVVGSAAIIPQVLQEPAHCGPLAASQWANAILRYWEDAIRHNEIDADSPLDVIDLMPGQGSTACLMLRALTSLTTLSASFKPTIRYLVVAPNRTILRALERQTEVNSWIERGLLIPTLWAMDSRPPCMLTKSGRIAWASKNPAIVLAHDCWYHAQNRLFAIHYGKIFEADFSKLDFPESTSEQVKQSSQSAIWQPASDSVWESQFRKLGSAYLSRLSSAPVPLPVGALHVIDQLEKLTPHGYMILAAANGFASEKSLRLCQIASVISAYRKNQAIPVNFHLLAHHFQVLGRATWQKNLRDDLAVQVAIKGKGDLPNRVSHVTTIFNQEAISDATALASAIHSTSRAKNLDASLTLLRLSNYDPAVFIAACPALHDTLREDIACDRAAWSDALRLVWQNHFPTHGNSQLHKEIARSAICIGDWALAKQVLRSGMSTHGENASDLARLALCETSTGRLLEAEALCKRALLLDEQDFMVIKVMSHLLLKIQNRDKLWRQPISHPQIPLMLEPLDEHHTEAYFYQYRDSQIAVMTGLPSLQSLHEVRTWIRSNVDESGRQSYAIMHADLGFVGYVSLHISEHAAFFCFWIGVDFQGHGFAVEAGKLLCSFARKKGITAFLTSAYHDNMRSLHALTRIGFNQITTPTLPPNDDRQFFFMDDGKRDSTDQLQEVLGYHTRENIAIEFSKDAGTLGAIAR